MYKRQGDNSEDQAINSDHDVHVVSFFRTSDSAVYQSSENMDNNTYPRDIFHISWHDTGGGNTEWGFSTIHSNIGINGEADYTYNTFDASYFTYSFTGPIFSNQKRYAEIEPQNENGYVYVGWTYSSSKGSPTAWSSNSDYRSSIGVDHIYKYNRSASNTKPSSSDNNNQGTVSLYYRKQFNSYFDCNGGRFSNGSTSRTLYYLAGVLFTLPEAPTRTGYTFGGWLENNGTRASAGQVYPDNWADSSKSFTAQWIPLSYKISYNSNGAGTYNPHTVIYGDSYGGDNLYNPSNNYGLSNGMTLSNNIFNVKYTNNGNSTYYMNFFNHMMCNY